MYRMGRSRLYTQFSEIPGICFLHIEENDIDVNYDQNRESDHKLAYLRQNTISKLVEHICSFVEYLLVGVGVGKVIVGQLLRRQPWAIKSPTFNDDVIFRNIKIEVRFNKIGRAYFLHHRGFWDSFAFLGRDGVHILNDRSDRQRRKKYLQSIKSTVLFAANH